MKIVGNTRDARIKSGRAQQAAAEKRERIEVPGKIYKFSPFYFRVAMNN